MNILSQLSPEQLTKYHGWKNRLDEAERTMQDSSIPYFGAIGGNITWTLIPTSLGTIVKANYSKHSQIDLTDYDKW